VLQALFWVPAILTIYVLYLLVSSITNPALLQAGISTWSQLQGVSGVTADTYVKAALAQGLDGAHLSDYWTAVSVSLLFAYFAYVGYAGTTFVAGEVKEPERNLPKILIIATILIVVIYVTMTYATTYAAASIDQITLPNGDRWSFFDAYSYLSYSGNLAQAGVPPLTARVQTIAEMIGLGLGMGKLNSILLFLFGVLWIFNDMPAFILTASRILFAMSFDRVLPSSLCKVNRFGSPSYAVILVGIFALIGLMGGSGSCIICTGGSLNPGGALGGILNAVSVDGISATDLLDVVFFSLFSVAVILLPFRGRRFFDRAHFKPGGKLGVTSIGVAGLIANLIIGWEVLISPTDSYNLLAPTWDNWFSLGMTAFFGIIGSLIYSYYRLGAGKQIDYSTIFSRIPPE